MRFGGSVTAFSHPSLPSTSFSRAALSHRPAVVGLKSSLQPSDANSDELDEGIRSRGQHPLERGVGRRAALGALLIAAAASCGSSPANAEAKTRVWGAAELDFRMYVCGATGKGCPAKTEVIVEKARKLDKALATSLIGVPVTALRATVGNKDSKGARGGGGGGGNTREVMEREFQKRAPFPIDDLSDQYSFDFETYVAFKAAADTLKGIDPQARKAFSRAVGDGVLSVLGESDTAGTLKAYDSRAEGLSRAISGCKYIISSLQKGGILANTDFDADDYDDMFWSFDGPPTTLKLTSDLPAFLQAQLQLSAEGGGVTANYLALTLSSYLESCKVNVEYNDYFVDRQYRPNPDDYQPDQLIVQFDVKPNPK